MNRIKFTEEFKTKVILSILGLSELTQRYGLAPTQISKWKNNF